MSIRNGKHLEIDPLATLFPPMAEEEFARLKADIATHGQLEPIWTHRGRVIDGRHRLRACRELGLEPVIREYDGDGTVLDFVIAKNLHRRHLSANQRALVAAKLASLSRGRPSKTARKQAVTQSDAAALLRIGRTTVQGARQVLDRGVPELVAAVERDAIKVSTAAAIAGLRAKQQANLVAQGPRAIRAKGSELRRAEKALPADGLSATDRKWLAALPLWDALGDNQASLIREALFWKQAQPLLDQIRRAFPGLDEESPDRLGPHDVQPVSFLFCVHHPRRWELCFSCEGTGVSNDPRDPRCNHCRGDGFTVTKRDWGEPQSTLVG
jgi:ParB-like chromosome segregation protein Spo0J